MKRIARSLLHVLFFIVPVLVLPADVVHVLVRGETLYSLSRRYGVSLDDLLSRNGISDPSGLAVGTRLIIPVAAGSGGGTGYTVAKGDTYYSIARKAGLSVDELLSANSRSADAVLRVGETLLLPSTRNGDAVAAPAAVPSASASADNPAPVRSKWVSDIPRWPVAGYLSPLEGKLAGVSIDTEPLSYVHAVSGGQVVWTGPYRGFGHVVLVDSNGYIYLYGGNEDLFVNVGQTVSAGSRIGRLGSAGPDGGRQTMIFSVFREGHPVSADEAPRG